MAGESLANHPCFTKLKPSKLVLTINNLLADLLICQSFFCQMLEKSQFAKLSCSTVLINTRFDIVTLQTTLPAQNPWLM